MYPTVQELLQDHVTLSVSCVDRLYVNGYVPTLQTPGQLAWFLGHYLGAPIPSPAQLRPIHDRFVNSVQAFAKQHDVPLIAFQRGQRKDDIAAAHRREFQAEQGVVFVGVAQERCLSFKSHKRQTRSGSVTFDFSRQSVYVNHYYFYFQDLQWGPGFLKIGSYAPYPVKLCLNGHEWVKQQLRREGIGFESLDNGLRSCEDPERLQQLCDQLGPSDVQAVFDRWSQTVPWPLSDEDRAAGFEHRLSIWQIEMSLTQVFDRPLRGREFFEQVIRENLDLGRPDRVGVLFPRRITRRTPPPRFGYRTRVITSGVQPSLHVEYKHSHVKQYFKEQRALRTETTINEPKDFGINKGLKNFSHLCDVGRQANRKLLEIENIGQHCLLSEHTLEPLQTPTRVGSQRASAMRFGDARVMALMQALCGFFHIPHGFRNRDLRCRVAELLGRPLEQYTTGQMTYDLRRLRLKGLIARIPNTYRYSVTTHGLRVALFFSKLYRRIFEPAWTIIADTANKLTRPLRQAFERVEREFHRLYREAQLSPMANLDSPVKKLVFEDV
jgi:hypothetical protein